jgi:hypothetical protein
MLGKEVQSNPKEVPYVLPPIFQVKYEKRGQPPL